MFLCKFSSDHSKEDAQKLAENLGICYVSIPIQETLEEYHRTLEKTSQEIRNYFGVKKEDDDSVVDENIQPRARGNCLMDISNQLKNLEILAVNTGNKTVLALGYCTLWGYDWRNRGQSVM